MFEKVSLSINYGNFFYLHKIIYITYPIIVINWTILRSDAIDDFWSGVLKLR